MAEEGRGDLAIGGLGDGVDPSLLESPHPPVSPSPRPAITDSPWFWLLLFAGFGIGAMLAIGPKYSLRQGGIETRFQNRQMARQWDGEEIDSAEAIEAVRLPTAPGERSLLISLRPLFIAIGSVIAAALLGIWYVKSKATPLQTDH